MSPYTTTKGDTYEVSVCVVTNQRRDTQGQSKDDKAFTPPRIVREQAEIFVGLRGHQAEQQGRGPAAHQQSSVEKQAQTMLVEK